MTTIDCFALAKAICADSAAELQRARGEIAYLVTLYGPVAVAQAARMGLDRRPSPSSDLVAQQEG